MAICGCGLPACCCQPAVAGGIIYADLWGELSTHLAQQALFTQSSPVRDATATSFSLSKHTVGGDTAPTFSGLCVCLQLTWEVGLPPSPVEFSSLRHSHKLSCSWLLDAPTLSSQAQLVCLQFWVGFPSPPSLLCVFIVLIAYYSVSLFSPGGGVGLSRGLCQSGPGLSVGVPCTT
jgi:hypothetical protein